MRLVRSKRTTPEAGTAHGISQAAPAHTSCLHRFAVATAVATLALVGIGGLVTSHGAGMAVPDWPNTYGYNMFFFPISQWMGGIFYEHTHRLAASAVGLLTVVLALWLYGRSARPLMRWAGVVLLLGAGATAAAMPQRWTDGLVLGLAGLALLGASRVWPRCEPSAKWLRRLGLAAFVAVVLQGVLGGLRVVLFKDALGILHATLAQLFFVLTCAIALFTSRWWQAAGLPAQPGSTRLRRVIRGVSPRIADQLVESPDDNGSDATRSRRRDAGGGTRDACAPQTQGPDAAAAPRSTLYALATGLILCQLALGAAMRHQHAGLAIPDFPLAYGRLWPATDADSVAHYNQQRIEEVAANPITAAQIELQMIHRLVAMSILSAVAYAAWATWRRLGGRNYRSRLTLAWLGLILTQVLLGAATIWSNKAADVATAHVLVGALSLALGAILCIVSSRELMFAYRETDLSSAPGARPVSGLNPLPSGATALP